ncbi:hypothetical protein [Paraburkholderia sp. RL17-347-BIC-D]|uniref:hypothetical protein n=1 Tax=Paraburkholderia sp. RL17-347-BIC-D TaxID=3031632 RepID=UPI0038BC4FF0
MSSAPIAWNVTACVSSYLFFCVLAADPKREAVFYIGNRWYGIGVASKPSRDPTFKIFGAGGLFWTMLLMGAVKFNPQYCSLRPVHFFSWETLFAAVTIMLSGKVLFGPAMHVSKTIKLVGGHKTFAQPISFRIYDALSILPANLTAKYSWELIIVSTMTGIVWLFGMKPSPGDVIPLPLALAWGLACFGKVAAFILHKKPAETLQLLYFAATILVGGVMWQLCEDMLKGCGATSGRVPSYETLAAGMFSWPFAESIGALFSTIF